MAPQQRTKFLIISDTHGQDFFSDDDGQREPFWDPSKLPQADVVLHCGDFTNNGSLPDNINALTMLSAFDAELKLVIPGNHDRTLDPALMKHASAQEQQTHEKVTNRWNGKKAKARGIHYLTEGFHSFTLASKATFTIFASPYTPEFNDWAFGYPHNIDRFDILTSTKTDIVMTHGPPRGYLDYANGQNLGCPHLLRAVSNARPQLHCFGHIHEGSGAQIVDWESSDKPQDIAHSDKAICIDGGNKTLMVNAAMVDDRNRPTLPCPWIVELDLPAP